MRNIKLIIEYDGTNYHGWQSQTNALSVQDVIERAIQKLTGEDCRLVGSGRTDVGVHALGQVANFHTGSRIPAGRFAHALNSVLPDDIVIRHSEEEDSGFHSRYSAKGKKYRYLIYNSEHPSALLRNRACHIQYPLDFGLMAEAASCFIGTHDFSAFRASGSNAKTSIRTITHVLFKEKDCGEIAAGKEFSEKGRLFEKGQLSERGRLFEFEVAGDGFLYNMVRIMAGTLIEVGAGKIPPNGIPEIIESRDRKKAGKTAPAHGLYLVEVYY